MSNLSHPIVTAYRGVPTTLSTNIADYFDKAHRSVIASIENIIKITPSDRLHNFVQTVVTRANPSGGAPIQSKAYRLTRDGFMFLVMGFTGPKAQAFKWAYIDEFNKMEAEIQQIKIQLLTQSRGLDQADLVNLRQAAVMWDYDIKNRAELIKELRTLKDARRALDNIDRLIGCLHEAPRECRMRLNSVIQQQEKIHQ